MDLVKPVEKLKEKIHDSFHKRLVRLGIKKDGNQPRDKEDPAYKKAISAIEAFKRDGLSQEEARDKYIAEVTFTLFNRLAGIKVMEVQQLIPEILQSRAKHGDRSFAHNVWLNENPSYKNELLEGLRDFINDKFTELSEELNLYSIEYPYHLLPELHDLKEIIDTFNNMIEAEKWEQDDILGWMYEAYNKEDYKQFKESGDKIEHDKLSLSSQMYTPRWVVEFLVNNSLGKYWLEINPDSKIKDLYDIANAPEERIVDYKKIEDIKVIDPAVGSGNFLIYAFDLFYEIYEDEGYNPDQIPNLILRNNLYGIDIDERAVQIARLQLYIKAKMKNRNTTVEEINVVSSDFYLPPFKEVKEEFSENLNFAINEREFIEELWRELRKAHKFGSLIRLQDTLKAFMESKQEQDKLGLFDNVTNVDDFEDEVITKLKDIIVSSQEKYNGIRFLKHQSIDALKFAEIMLSKYDIAVANPPYTDSSNYGKELKQFVINNYKKPKNFHQNLYAAFLKKNTDLINKQGKIGMIHPLTFMYIKTYEDMREYILNEFHINIMVDYGLDRRNLFGPGILLNASLYIFEKGNHNKKSLFIDVNSNLQEKYKKGKMLTVLKDVILNKSNKRFYRLIQNKLKIIDGYPFIYWISDSFREKFKGKQLDDILDVRQGMATSNNLRFLRFWWEVNEKDISQDYEKDQKKWVPYQKGGEYKKWYGNNWVVLKFDKKSKEYLSTHGNKMPSKQYYFKEGLTYSLASAPKGISIRYLPKNNIFDVGGSCIFLRNENIDQYYIMGFMNSDFVSYIVNCLNPSVNSQVGDFKRVPFVYPDKKIENKVESLSRQNVNIKKHLNEFSIIEREFKYSPLDYNWKQGITNPEKRLKSYIDYKYSLDSQILLNEAVIEELIFNVYDLNERDREMVLEKEGFPAGLYPVFEGDKKKYISFQQDLIKEVVDFINDLDMEKRDRNNLKDEVKKLYLKNISVEDIAKELKLNPISITEIIKEFNSYPGKKAYQITHEFVLDLVREILQEDEDGISILNEYANEKPLNEKIKEKLIGKGFSSGDISRLESMLGKNIKNYLLNSFFKDECNTLNLFMYQPKTPFVWHLISGKEHGFDAFTLIYKWSRDSVFKIKSFYIDKRRSGLKNMLNNLADDDSASAEKEKDKIRKQLKEIDEFEEKLDKLLASGYDPELDDGVGRNIASLQDLDLLADDVLTNSQLKKFLNADW